MWTTINQIFATNESQNAWANLALDGAWHKVLPKTPDGVTNVYVLLVAARANSKQVFVVLDAGKNITQAYL